MSFVRFPYYRPLDPWQPLPEPDLDPWSPLRGDRDRRGEATRLADASAIDASAIAIRFPPVLDATMRSSFLLCPHHFFRRHCQGLRHPVVSVHLHFGGCVAKGLEVTRRRYCAGVSQHQAVLDGTEALIREWGTLEFTPHSYSEERKTLDNAILCLADYFVHWPLDTDPVRIHWYQPEDAAQPREPCIEFSGFAPIPGVAHPQTGEPITYSVRFDMIGDFEHSVWGVDDKTASNLGREWRKQWTLRGQFTGYTWVANEYDFPVKGFLIRGIQPLKERIQFEEAISARPQWLIDRWLLSLVEDVKRMIHMWHAYADGEPIQQAYRQILDTGCFSYNRACEFMPLCNSPDPDRWLDEYEVSHWNPLTRQDDTAS